MEMLVSILGGYLRHLVWFNGLALPLTLILLAAALWSLFASRQFLTVLPLALIPIVQIYAFSINIKVASVEIPWTYFTRRYMDFLLPFLVILLCMGAAFLWNRVSQRRNRWALLLAPLLMVGVLFVMGRNIFQLHNYLIEQYSWNTENVEQVNVAMGKWIGEYLPDGSTIGVTDDGGMRYWSRPDQTIIDFLGLNCASCIGRPMEELVAAFRPDYLVVFRPALTERLNYEELYSIQTRHNTILGGNELVAIKIKP